MALEDRWESPNRSIPWENRTPWHWEIPESTESMTGLKVSFQGVELGLAQLLCNLRLAPPMMRQASRDRPGAVMSDYAASNCR